MILNQITFNNTLLSLPLIAHFGFDLKSIDTYWEKTQKRDRIRKETCKIEIFNEIK